MEQVGLVISTQPEAVLVALSGSWKLAQSAALKEQCKAIALPKEAKAIHVDGSALSSIDTLGAYLLLDFLRANKVDPAEVHFVGFQPAHRELLALTFERTADGGSMPRLHHLGLVARLGKGTLDSLGVVTGLIHFIGQTVFEAVAIVRHRRLRWKELVVQLEQVLLNAIPVTLLVMFLIGVVIAYLFAGQVEKYGANIFIVDAVAISLCRELCPVIVAIIVAGRSGSAFTAQIGTMKLNQEIDALQTLGLSPLQVLVMPRLIALALAMPFLVLLGDVIGIGGGLLVAHANLGVTGPTFIQRLQTVLTVRSFLVGIVKAPVFAAFIAVIGCRMGLAVENNARSVGINTTATVVQSLVSVILLNAAFAIIFINLHI